MGSRRLEKRMEVGGETAELVNRCYRQGNNNPLEIKSQSRTASPHCNG